MGFRAAIRTGRRGPKVVLSTIQRPGSGEYWIAPQKFTIEVADQIRAKLLPLGKMLSATPDFNADNPDPKQLIDVLQTTEGKHLEAIREVLVLQLREGIADHNFDDDEGNLVEGVTDEIIAGFLEFPELANEVAGIIREFNAPLSQASGKKSIP